MEGKRKGKGGAGVSEGKCKGRGGGGGVVDGKCKGTLVLMLPGW